MIAHLGQVAVTASIASALTNLLSGIASLTRGDAFTAAEQLGMYAGQLPAFAVCFHLCYRQPSSVAL